MTVFRVKPNKRDLFGQHYQVHHHHNHRLPRVRDVFQSCLYPTHSISHLRQTELTLNRISVTRVEFHPVLLRHRLPLSHRSLVDDNVDPVQLIHEMAPV